METKLVRVPFEVELAKRIQNGECEGKIVTRDGRSARVICWDRQYERPIMSLIVWDDIEEARSVFINGKIDENREDFYDLMLEIPEYMTFKDGDVVSFGLNKDLIGVFKSFDCNRKSIFSSYVTLVGDNLTFYETGWVENNLKKATETEKQKLIAALKESKDPKAKEYLKRFFGIEQKQKYEFKPKDWVLCRNGNEEWYLCRFSHITVSVDRKLLFVAVGGIFYDKCIPYNEQTAHLLGTTDNWEE